MQSSSSEACYQPGNEDEETQRSKEPCVQVSGLGLRLGLVLWLWLCLPDITSGDGERAEEAGEASP